MTLRIIVTIDDIAPRSDRYVAMTAEAMENYEPEYHAGRAATPRGRIGDDLTHSGRAVGRMTMA